MALPNLLVIGAQKSGTSALYQIFKRHPECEVGTRKESHFFVDEADGVFGKWRRGVGWYESLYERNAAVVADVSPSYAAWPILPKAAERAASVVPDATIVYLVRDPLERIVSHWRHWTARGFERRPFAEAVLDPSERNEYVVCSSYATQLRQWLAVFPSERVLVVHQDDVRAGAPSVLGYFGLSPVDDPEAEFNVTDERFARRPRVGRRVQRALLQRLEPEIDEFASMTGMNLTAC